MNCNALPCRAAAVMGASFFGDVAPDNFATFDAAFVTLFYVTGGDPWPDSLPKYNEDGTTNWEVGLRSARPPAGITCALRHDLVECSQPRGLSDFFILC